MFDIVNGNETARARRLPSKKIAHLDVSIGDVHLFLAIGRRAKEHIVRGETEALDQQLELIGEPYKALREASPNALIGHDCV